MNYIPLNVKTHYELLSSLIKIEDLISFCAKNNVKAVGITDSNMFGSMELINYAKINNIKPIIGIEVNFENLSMILYAKNYNGYVNLLNIVSIRNTSEITYEVLNNHKNDLICVTKDYENYTNYKEFYEEVYLSYQNNEEKKNALIVSDKIVYIEKNLYINYEDREYLNYLYMIKDGKTIDNINEYNFNNHLNKDIDMIDAITTRNFASLINIEMPEFKFELPEFAPNKVEILTNLCNKGLNKRLQGNVPLEYKSRLDYELKVIIEMGFTDYFLIVYDFILYAKKNNIRVGPGRGSAAGSLVSFTLGITEIDPLKYNLIFERFLNPERITMPDIDTDIDFIKRDEVIKYVKNKYGIYNVANIITFGTLLTKQVLRDTGRILKMSTTKIDRIVKTIKDKETIKELKNNSMFLSVYKSDYEYENLLRIASHLEGLKRHTSIHAAGVVISRYPLMDRVPLYKSADTLLTGYTMEHLENLGLLKMDFLAIRNLTVIDNIVNKVKEEKNIYIDVNKIPLNDYKTLKIFYDVNTTGIFQFESEGMMGFLKSLKVRSFLDLVVAIALYRPGPREAIPEFISVREGKKKAHYIVSSLESILKETNGIIVYQEQILEILKKIGGFSYSSADIIRRAMSKKKEDVIIKYREDFINGSIKNGYSMKDASEIYDLVLKFANYGFNKSHSVAYSLLAYQMAFLKAHFPLYYISAMLDIQIGSEIKTKEYIDEARLFNIKINYVDINKSDKYYKVIDNEIVLPLSIIKNLGSDNINNIINERKNGVFIDYYDFIKRIYKYNINRKAIESLILGGALDSFKLNRNTLISNIQIMLDYAMLCQMIDSSLVEKPEIIYYQEFLENELVKQEYDVYGFYIKNHPVTRYKRDNTCLLKDISKYYDKIVNVVCIIDVIKETTTKKKERMAFLTISDEYSKMTAILFPKVYASSFGLKKGDIIKVLGKVEKRLSDYQLIVTKVEKL